MTLFRIALLFVALALPACSREPTADERYGCTQEQADPKSGECY